MRFMVMHKVDANMEAGGPPSPQIISSMGALVQESLRNGTFTTGAGLHRSARRARLECQAGVSEVTKGPYVGKNELVASFAMIKANSLEEAIERARQFARVLGDVEIEVGPVVEPWDLGVVPKPAGEVPGRFLLLHKGNRATEGGAEPSLTRRTALLQLIQALKAEGVLISSEFLAPTSRARRLSRGADGKRTWTDGPFTESKELIAGFSILEVPNQAAAIAWADRYAAILTDSEVDVRELVD
jgi:hypothetical protein